MEWSKIRNILILLLVAVNAFLLVLVMDREAKSRSYEERALEEVVTLLARDGISLTWETPPQELTLTAMTVPRDQEDEAARAAALLGASVTSGGDGVYLSPTGSLRFYSDGAFSFAPAQGAFPVGEGSPSDITLALLRKLGVEGKLAAFDAEAETVTVGLRWQGVTIYPPRSTTVVFRDGFLISAEGYRLSGEPVAAGDEAPLSVITILLRLFDHIKASVTICSEITAMVPGYQLTAAQGSQPSLTPVWHITTDTGEYVFHAITGALLE